MIAIKSEPGPSLSMLIDFTDGCAELVPSSARSVSSAAAPLPPQLEPLLQPSLEKMKEVIGKVLPVGKKRTALEEAEWEDESSEGALDRELMLQCKSNGTNALYDILTPRQLWKPSVYTGRVLCCMGLSEWARHT